jgi:hypothetical protein
LKHFEFFTTTAIDSIRMELVTETVIFCDRSNTTVSFLKLSATLHTNLTNEPPQQQQQQQWQRQRQRQKPNQKQVARQKLAFL